MSKVEKTAEEYSASRHETEELMGEKIPPWPAEIAQYIKEGKTLRTG